MTTILPGILNPIMDLTDELDRLKATIAEQAQRIADLREQNTELCNLVVELTEELRKEKP